MSEYTSVQINADAPTGPDAPAPAPQGNERPSWLPENFKSAEDLAKSYKEAQAELTRLKQGKAAVSEQGVPTEESSQSGEQTPPTNDLAIKEAVEAKGVDFDALGQEFMSNKGLTPESYEKLSKAGFPKELVDDYIRLKQSEASTIVTDLKGSVGGEEQFTAMVSWAAENYSAKDTYNKMINSGDPDQMKIAVDALSAAYHKANGTRPNLVMGGTGSVGGDVYRDQAEFLRDIQDPKYKTSEAFRKDVEAKLSRSNIM